jgi:hypothetical protein
MNDGGGAERASALDDGSRVDPSHRVYESGLKPFGVRKWRQQSSERPGQHGLPGAGRAHHQEMMSTGGSHLETPFCRLMPRDVFESDQYRAHRAARFAAGRECLWQSGAK